MLRMSNQRRFYLPSVANTNKSSLKSLLTLNNKIRRVLQEQPYCTRTADLYEQ